MKPEYIHLRNAFGRAAATYDAAANFQREAGEQLLSDCPDDVTPLRMLDAGCGTGHGLQLIAKRWTTAQSIAIDFAEPMLGRATLGNDGKGICGDIEQLPLKSGCVDLVWSNLAMQWCDYGRTAFEFHRVLRAKGVLAATTLGSNTFVELRRAFAGVDQFRHTNDFIEEDGLRAAIRQAGFSLQKLRRVEMVRHYPDLRALLASVRDLGASRVAVNNRRQGLMGKSAWQCFADNYDRQRVAEGLPLTYDTYFIIARK